MKKNLMELNELELAQVNGGYYFEYYEHMANVEMTYDVGETFDCNTCD